MFVASNFIEPTARPLIILKLIDANLVDHEILYGSWAGAYGNFQFMHSSIQKYAIDSTRMKIPIIYGIDAIHGTTYTAGSTMFPQQINTAASWNEENAYNMALVTAYETRASGIPWNFSPVLDLGIDPRFPRQFETFGEDPLIVERFGEAMIKGYQGE